MIPLIIKTAPAKPSAGVTAGMIGNVEVPSAEATLSDRTTMRDEARPRSGRIMGCYQLEQEYGKVIERQTSV